MPSASSSYFLGNIQKLAAHIGVVHSLDLPTDNLRPLQVLFGAGLKRIWIVSHIPYKGLEGVPRKGRQSLKPNPFIAAGVHQLLAHRYLGEVPEGAEGSN